MTLHSSTWNTISWTLSAIFLILGVLNAFLIHIVPGLFYLVLAFFYYPPVNPAIKKVLRFSFPPVLKIILGLMILWGSLAVGDLMEMFEAWYLR